MLRAPRGESRPPTIVNPSPFFPLPFSNMTVWKEQTDDRGLRGRVQKLVVEVRPLSSLLPSPVIKEERDVDCRAKRPTAQQTAVHWDILLGSVITCPTHLFLGLLVAR